MRDLQFNMTRLTSGCSPALASGAPLLGRNNARQFRRIQKREIALREEAVGAVFQIPGLVGSRHRKSLAAGKPQRIAVRGAPQAALQIPRMACLLHLGGICRLQCGRVAIRPGGHAGIRIPASRRDCSMP